MVTNNFCPIFCRKVIHNYSMLLDRNKADSQVDEEANKASFEIIIVIIVFNL